MLSKQEKSFFTTRAGHDGAARRSAARNGPVRSGPVRFAALLILMISVALPWVLAPELMAQESTGAAAGYEAPIGFGRALNRPTMITVEQNIEARVEMSGLGINSAMIDHSHTLIMIDTVTKLDEESSEAQRYYAKHTSTTNGQITDSIFSGLECNFVAADDDVEVTLGGNRSALDRDLDAILADYQSIGLWVKFPKSAKVGEIVTIDVANLAPLICEHGMRCESATAGLKFDAYDRLTTIAKLSGDVRIEQSGYVQGLDSTLEFTGTIKLEANIQQKLVTRVELDGNFEYEGGVSGKGSMTTKLETELDKKKIDRQRKRKAKFRKRIHRLPKLGIQLKLPAYWSEIASDEGQVVLARSLDFDRGVAYLDIKLIEGDATRPNFFFDKVEGALRQDYPDLVTKKARCPLGVGRTYYIKSGKGKGADLFRSEVYPWKGQFLLMRVYGPPKVYSRAEKELIKSQSSIGPIRY